MKAPLRLLRVANPVVCAVLDSPAHALLSRRVLVLTYRGRRSGRSFRIPLLYALAGSDVIALAVDPARKQWWRTFRQPAPAELLLQGHSHHVIGTLVTGSAAERALAAYVEHLPRTRRTLGVVPGAPDAELAAATRRVAVVAFSTAVPAAR